MGLCSDFVAILLLHCQSITFVFAGVVIVLILSGHEDFQRERQRETKAAFTTQGLTFENRCLVFKLYNVTDTVALLDE